MAVAEGADSVVVAVVEEAAVATKGLSCRDFCSTKFEPAPECRAQIYHGRISEKQRVRIRRPLELYIMAVLLCLLLARPATT